MGFEPTISVGERPQIYSLDRAATGTGYNRTVFFVIILTVLHITVAKRTEKIVSYGIWGLESSGSIRVFQMSCCLLFENVILVLCRSQWPCGLRRRSAADRLLRSWVRILPWKWMFVMSVVCYQVEVSATS